MRSQYSSYHPKNLCALITIVISKEEKLLVEICYTNEDPQTIVLLDFKNEDPSAIQASYYECGNTPRIVLKQLEKKLKQALPMRALSGDMLVQLIRPSGAFGNRNLFTLNETNAAWEKAIEYAFWQLDIAATCMVPLLTEQSFIRVKKACEQLVDFNLKPKHFRKNARAFFNSNAFRKEDRFWRKNRDIIYPQSLDHIVGNMNHVLLKKDQDDFPQFFQVSYSDNWINTKMSIVVDFKDFYNVLDLVHQRKIKNVTKEYFIKLHHNLNLDLSQLISDVSDSSQLSDSVFKLVKGFNEKWHGNAKMIFKYREKSKMCHFVVKDPFDCVRIEKQLYKDNVGLFSPKKKIEINSVNQLPAFPRARSGSGLS